MGEKNETEALMLKHASKLKSDTSTVKYCTSGTVGDREVGKEACKTHQILVLYCVYVTYPALHIQIESCYTQCKELDQGRYNSLGCTSFCQYFGHEEHGVDGCEI